MLELHLLRFCCGLVLQHVAYNKVVKGSVLAFSGNLRSVTCRKESRSVTCHPTQMNAPRLHPSQIGRYSIYLPRRDGRLSWHRRLVTYRDGLQSPIQVLTWPSVE